MKKVMLVIAFLSTIGLNTYGQDKSASTILITNAKIFDGTDELVEGKSVLIVDHKISQIGANIKAPKGAQVIDAGGRTMTPGFIFMHEHLMFQMSSPALLTSDSRYKAYVATRTVKEYLMHGITTVRDAAGNTFSLQKLLMMV